MKVVQNTRAQVIEVLRRSTASPSKLEAGPESGLRLCSGDMRILTAGFDHAESEELGQRLSDAGHRVMSASGASSARTLASSVSPDVLMVPSGERGVEAQTWASDLLSGVTILVLSVDSDPVTLLDSLKAPRSSADVSTEEIDEEVLVAALSASPSPTLASPSPQHTHHESEAAILAAIGEHTEHTSESALLAAMQDQERLAHLPSPPAPRPQREMSDTTRRSTTLRSTLSGPSIQDKVHDIRFGDYHAILEVQPGASTYVVRQQYDQLKELYTPSGWHQPLGPSDIDSLDEIEQGLDDAFAVLGHPIYQSRYESALEAGSQSRA